MKIKIKDLDKFPNKTMAEVLIEEFNRFSIWEEDRDHERLKIEALYRNDKSLDPDYCNPFYSNHVFTEADARRVKIRKRDKLWLWLFPTFVQASGGSRFYFKCVNGAYYLMKTDHL